MTPTQNDPARGETSWTVGERSAGKRLGKFGCAVQNLKEKSNDQDR